MTAGILNQHGVAVGSHNAHPKFNPKGSFENSKMKAVLHGAIKRNGMPLNPIAAEPVEPDLPGIGERLRGCVKPGDGPWLVKETKLLWFYRNLSGQFPQAVWVLPVREREGSIRSMLRHDILPGRMRDAMQREGITATVEQACGMYWDRCHERQKFIAERSPHVWVRTDAIANGDMEEARSLVTACGLTFDPALVESFVNRSYWHA